MGYQEELREQARKKARRNYLTKMVMLIIFLVVVLFIIHFLDAQSDKLINQTNNKKTIDKDTTLVEQVPLANETK